jgi:phosphatidylglycerol---prolipoprotein diacylglyceryl transferase
MSDVVYAWVGLFRDHPAAITYVAAWLTAGVVWIAGTCWLASRDGLSPARTVSALVLVLPAVFVGARAHALLGEAQVPLADIVARPSVLLEPGWRLPGGLLLAMVVGPLAAWLLRLPPLGLADAALPFVGASFAVGRIGCFLQGCCHGRPTSLPWGVRFGAASEAYANHAARGLLPAGATESLPVHPLQLYIAAGGLLVTAILLWSRRRRRFAGATALLGVVLLSAMNASFELLRDTEGMAPVRGRSALPVIVGLVALGVWVRASRRHTPMVTVPD